MNITDVITLIGAIATFLFGMSTMTDGLEKLSSGRLEGILERLTSNVFRGVLLGALVTGLIQSSAATTVMCVGFVNAGIMKLEQTVGIIMGANIGTTVTAQLLRLGDISSDNLLLLLLKPSVLGPSWLRRALCCICSCAAGANASWGRSSWGWAFSLSA
ncbi:MAG: Na/Pi symporter [Intestinimonas sp.]